MKERTLQQLETDVLKDLLGWYFSNKSVQEIMEIVSDKDWGDFVKDGYNQYLFWEKENPGAKTHWGASVSAAAYNIFMWF